MRSYPFTIIPVFFGTRLSQSPYRGLYSPPYLVFFALSSPSLFLLSVTFSKLISIFVNNTFVFIRVF